MSSFCFFCTVLDIQCYPVFSTVKLQQHSQRSLVFATESLWSRQAIQHKRSCRVEAFLQGLSPTRGVPTVSCRVHICFCCFCWVGRQWCWSICHSTPFCYFASFVSPTNRQELVSHHMERLATLNPFFCCIHFTLLNNKLTLIIFVQKMATVKKKTYLNGRRGLTKFI